MTRELVSVLETEIESLEAELREDIRFVRLQALRQTLALYVDPENAMGQIRYSGSSIVHPGNISRGPASARQYKPDISTFGSAHRAAGRRTSVEKSQALDAAAMMLRNRSGPVPTREILDHIIDLGIDIGGASPANNLSATLSNSDRFKSMGRLGWILNEVDQSSAQDPDDIDPLIFKRISMDYLDEQTPDGIIQLSNYVEFSGEIPDSVKEELAARYKMQTGYDYEVNSGKFQAALVRELEDMSVKNDE